MAALPTFREVLTSTIERKGWSVGELARQARIPYATAKSWFQTTKANKSRLPSVKHLIAVALALKVEISELLQCEEFQIDLSADDSDLSE